MLTFGSSGQFTTNGGSSWTDIYQFSPVDISWYFDGVAVPSTRLFASPTINNVVNVAVGANLQTVVNAAPNGTKFVFPNNATYTMTSGIYLQNRNNLVFEGNGSTIHTTGSGSATASSPFKIDNGVSDIAVNNFTLTGSNPDTGTAIYHPGVEGQMGLAVYGCTRLEVSNCKISNMYGDGMYISDVQDVWLHDSQINYVGRMGVAFISGDNITIERNILDNIGLIAFDVEPDSSGSNVTDLTIQDNTVGAYSLSGYQTNWFFACAANHGNSHARFNILRNRVTVGASTNVNNPAGKGGLATRLDTTDRVNGVNFKNNTTTVVGHPTVGYPGVLYFAHVDGLTVTGNDQPMSSGTKVSAVDCTNAIITPNP